MAKRKLKQKDKCQLKTANKNTCANCGIVSSHTEIDHIIPLWEGGNEDISNLQVLCYECHKAKSAEEHRRYSKLHPVTVIKDGVIMTKSQED